MTTIFVIDADPAVSEQIQDALGKTDYQIARVPTLSAARDCLKQTLPTLLILEMAQAQSLEFCQELRRMPMTAKLPILLLAGDHSAQQIAEALDAGGDDHLHKPFASREFAARVRALLRRTTPARDKAVLLLEPQAQAVTVGGRRVALTRTEYDLLAVLCERRGEPLTTEMLLHEVWRYPLGAGDTALVRNHIHNLRNKLEVDPYHPHILLSRHGRGYLVTASSEIKSQV